MQEPADADAHVPLDVADAWRNGPALASLLITLAVVALVGLPVAASATRLAWPIAVILCSVLAGLGVSAAGSQFAEQAAGRPVSGVACAFAAAPRIVLGSLLLAVVLAGALAMFLLLSAAVLFACRLPVVGPLLLVIALPALTIAGAALLVALVGAPLLALPALWEGHSLRTALAQLCAIAAQRRRRAFGCLILPLLAAGLVVATVSIFVLAAFALIAAFAVPLSGATPIDGVAGLVIEPSLAGADAMAIAAPAGVALLAGITIALSVAVVLYGIAIAYRRCTEGMDIAVARAAVARAIVELQVRKGEAAEQLALFLRGVLGARVPATAGRADLPAAEAAPATIVAEEGRGPLLACARCASSAQVDDVYCGNCGQRLSSPPVA